MRSSISDLPDDLLIKILTFLSIKDAGATRLLSKRWRYLWSLVPRTRLKFDVSDHIRFGKSIRDLLTLYESHVIESLHFKVNTTFLWNKNIGPWIKTALHHHHCHLHEIEVDAYLGCTLLPNELFTCKNLVVLKLKGTVIDVGPLKKVSLPSLRTLHLDMKMFDYRSFQMLLSNCNLVTDLMAMRAQKACEFDFSWCKSLAVLKLEGLNDVRISSSSVAAGLPFLKTLHIARVNNLSNDCFCHFLSNCPLLSDLTVEEETIDAMLNLDFTIPALKRLSIIREIESSTHLISLLDSCIQKFLKIAPSFNYLNIQERNICPSLSVRFSSPTKLEDASIFPRSVVLKLNNVKTAPLYHWEPPSFVPECLLSSLEAFEWKGYTGEKGDMELVTYLLNHALCLKTAKIFYFFL